MNAAQLSLINLTIFISILTSPVLAYAQTSSNSDYTLEHKGLEQKSYHSENQSANNNRVIIGKNYQAVLGFGDIVSQFLFSAKISSNLIDYGKLYPTNPILRDLSLELDSRSSHGYTVIAYEDHPLADSTLSNLIPDTSCDRGLCSQTTSAIWQDRLTYGFGYTCENIGRNVCVGFEDSGQFKRFSDGSKPEKYEPVIAGVGKSIDKAKIIHKLNLSASQKDKAYINNLYYIVIPNI